MTNRFEKLIFSYRRSTVGGSIVSQNRGIVPTGVQLPDRDALSQKNWPTILSPTKYINYQNYYRCDTGLIVKSCVISPYLNFQNI